MDYNGYHFTNETLLDGRPVPAIGEALVHEGEIKIRSSGLHFSRTAFRALLYAPGNMLHRVYCEDIVDEHEDDKAVCRKRTIVASIDAESLLRDFARKCALDVVHLWGAPQVVIDYLSTGDECLRAAAKHAAWNATKIFSYAAPTVSYAAGAVLQASEPSAWEAAKGAAGAARAGIAYPNFLKAMADQSKYFNKTVDDAFAAA